MYHTYLWYHVAQCQKNENSDFCGCVRMIVIVTLEVPSDKIYKVTNMVELAKKNPQRTKMSS